MNVDIFRRVRDAIRAAAPDAPKPGCGAPHIYREEILNAVSELLCADGYGETPGEIAATFQKMEEEDQASSEAGML